MRVRRHFSVERIAGWQANQPFHLMPAYEGPSGLQRPAQVSG